MVRIGEWVKSGSHGSVAHLRNSVPFGINFAIPRDWKCRTNVVYAFILDGVVEYVGETTRGVADRFSGYRYGNPLVSDTDNRVKLGITTCLEKGGLVEIWACQPVAAYALSDGEFLNVPASKPLEEHLIAALVLLLNVKRIGGRHA